MLKQLSDWLDDRTGYKHLLHETLDEPVKGGARWRYVFGSAVTTAFMIQLVTMEINLEKRLWKTVIFI